MARWENVIIMRSFSLGHLFAHGAWYLLWLFYISSPFSVGVWKFNLNFNDSDSFFRPYFTMRTNEFSRGMVITSLLGALPGIGADILLLLWGSYAIDNTTLHRFYSLHYTLPFIIFMLTILHFALLHEFGSIMA